MRAVRDASHDIKEGTYFNQDELVQEYSSAHIRDCYSGHNDESANEKSLGPCFEDEPFARGRLQDLV
jgi:hypothetical protein